jgi:hypothetical protein
VFASRCLAALPAAARRYLDHAIAGGTRMASAVYLRMHGEIKLRGWLPFRAEEVIRSDRGFIWAATVKMFGLPIRGSDRLLDGEGSMRWKLLGIVPVMCASGPQITRSAVGRFHGEAVWLPSMLWGETAVWTVKDNSKLVCRLTACGETTEMELDIDRAGCLKTLKLPRWGNPDAGEYRYADFGVVVEQESRFEGYTIPGRIRAGWHFAGDGFEREGEFFRATIDAARYR